MQPIYRGCRKQHEGPDEFDRKCRQAYPTRSQVSSWCWAQCRETLIENQHRGWEQFVLNHSPVDGQREPFGDDSSLGGTAQTPVICSSFILLLAADVSNGKCRGWPQFIGYLHGWTMSTDFNGNNQVTENGMLNKWMLLALIGLRDSRLVTRIVFLFFL